MSREVVESPFVHMPKKKTSVSIPEIFLFYIADFICAYPLFIKVT